SAAGAAADRQSVGRRFSSGSGNAGRGRPRGWGGRRGHERLAAAVSPAVDEGGLLGVTPHRLALHRLALPVLFIAAFLLPLAGLGVRQAIRSNANDVRDWVPSHYIETRDYRWFRQHFGNEDFVVVSWPGCKIGDPQLDQFATRLRERNELSEERGQVAPFRRITTGSELISQMTAEPVSLNRDRVIAR